VQASGGGAAQAGQTVWTDEASGLVYSLVARGASQDLVITWYEPGSPTQAAARVTVRGWSEGQLGIQLGAGAGDTPPEALLAGGFIKALQPDGQTYQQTAPGRYVAAGEDPLAADLLLGAGGAEQLQGGGGNDGLAGNGGDDWLSGGEGDDVLLGGAGADWLQGGSGNDFIAGSGTHTGFVAPTRTDQVNPAAPGEVIARGFGWVASWLPAQADGELRPYTINLLTGQAAADAGNLIDGGVGNDIISAGTGADIVWGGDGNDVVSGMHGADVVWGDAGDDQLWGDGTLDSRYLDHTPAEQHGADLLLGGDGHDQLVGQGGDDQLEGGAGNDRLSGDAPQEWLSGVWHGADWLDGGDGDDQVDGDGGDDRLWGGAGNDVLWGDAKQADLDGVFHGSDWLDGGAGDDLLSGFGGDDWLLGGEGNDTLWGDAIASQLDAGFHGNDHLDGGAGDDALEGGGGADVMLGGAGADQLVGGDGDDTLDGGQGIDDYSGGAGHDTYRFVAGEFGATTLGAMETLTDAGGVDAVRFAGHRVDDLSEVVVAGAGLMLRFANGDQLWVDDGHRGSVESFVFQAEQAAGDAWDAPGLIGRWADTAVTGALPDGTAFATGGRQADTLTTTAHGAQIAGGRGDDLLQGQGSGNTYRYHRGDGRDRIIDGSLTGGVVGPGGRSTIAFGPGIGPDDLSLVVVGGLLELRVRGVDGLTTGSDAIQIAGFNPANAGAVLAVDTLRFADGTALSLGNLLTAGFLLVGSPLGEAQNGTNLNDRFAASAGDDVLSGGLGSDTYLWTATAGQDVIVDADPGTTAQDTLDVSASFRQADLQWLRMGNDLVLTSADGSAVVAVQGHFAGTGAGVEWIRFADATVSARVDLSPLPPPAPTAGDDVLTGSLVADNIAAGAGHDRVRGLGGNDSLYGNAGADLLDGGSGADALYGGDGDDRLIGGDGDDVLYGEAGHDTLEGGAGRDTMHGGDGNNTLMGGAGNDFLRSFSAWDGLDTLRGEEGNDEYELRYGSGHYANAIAIDSATDSSDTYRVVQSGAVSTWGQRSFVVRDAGGSADLLRFEGSESTWANARVRSLGDGLQISLWNIDVRLEGMFDAQGVAGAGAIETVSFAGGQSRTLAQLMAAALQSTEGDDTIRGFGGADTVSGGGGHDILEGLGGDDVLLGGSGNDRLSGGAGNDRLEAGADGAQLLGGAGDDVYVVGAGDGVVQIGDRTRDSAEDQGYDTLRLSALPGGVSMTIQSVAGSPDDDTLSIRWLDGSTTVSFLLEDHDASSAPVERIEWADGSVFDLGAWLAAGRPVGTSDADDVALSGLADVFLAGDGDDRVRGRAGHDTLSGGAGNDWLDGGSGDDVLQGGAGDDTIASGSGRDRVLFGVGDGQDRILAQIGAQTTLQFEPGIAAEGLSVRWGSGFEFLSASVIPSQNMAGQPTRWEGPLEVALPGSADGLLIDFDSYLFNGAWVSVPNGAHGVSSVEFADGTQWSWADLVNRANTVTAGDDVLVDALGVDTLVGEAGHDRLFGLSGNNTLIGGEGDDILQGGDQQDVLYGGDGNDQLMGGLGSDELFGGAGNDTILALSGIYSPPSAAADFDRVNGGAGNDAISVGDGAVEYLFGLGDGHDTIRGSGFRGNTSAVLVLGDGIRPQDVVVSRSAMDSGLVISFRGTNDLIDVDRFFVQQGSMRYETSLHDQRPLTRIAFADGTTWTEADIVSRLENRTTETGDWLRGSASADTLLGAGGVDEIWGEDGDDVIVGGAELDRLDGGAGNDRFLYGLGDGSDTVNGRVGDADELVFGVGIDPALMTVTASSSPWPDERLYWLAIGGTEDVVTLQGIEFVQFANGVRWSRADLDLEARTQRGGAGADLLVGTAEADRLYGFAGNDTLRGAGGDDWLDGGLGADRLEGGAGNDTLVVDDAADVVVEASGGGVDRVLASVSHVLAGQVEDLELTGTAHLNGTGNSLANRLTGNAGNNWLDGGAGNDTLIGGAGDDTYVVAQSGDIVQESAGNGTDTVRASIAWTLGAHTEKLVLTGTSAINGSGNALDNELTGNSANNTLRGFEGNDTLDGGAGTDTLIGGVGDDVYVVERTTDIVTEVAGEGTDTVRSSVAWTLGAHLERLTLTGSSAINGTGNTLDNVLTGNTAANTLSGGAGHDLLRGMGGNDTLAGGTGHDTYLFGRGEGADTIQENDSTAGNTDVLRFLEGIAAEQLWFRRQSNHLEISVIGTADKVTVSGWYNGSANRVERFEISNGEALVMAQVDQLVSAMAAFSPPPMGQTELSSAQLAALTPVIAASWN
jgi:trimeric autotransporter adhesin